MITVRRQPGPRLRAYALQAMVTFAGLAAVPATTAQSAPQAVKPSEQAKASATIVVGKKCQQCHKAVVESFSLDAHGRSAKFLTDSRAATCESCHGDSEKHNQTTENKDTLNPTKLSAPQANASCLICHAKDRNRMLWHGNQHDRSDMNCLSCHSVHHAKSDANLLAKRTEEETCLSCHTNRRADFYKRSTHLFRTEQREMKVNCSSCHNPHGGEAGKMLLSHSISDLCYKCHAEKRGPFLWEHAPVRENCMNCHSPHGTSNPKLLTARVHLVCQQCHIHLLPRHSTAAGKPLDIWSINRGCANCHSQVHGSNHPSGRTFTR